MLKAFLASAHGSMDNKSLRSKVYLPKNKMYYRHMSFARIRASSISSFPLNLHCYNIDTSQCHKWRKPLWVIYCITEAIREPPVTYGKQNAITYAKLFCKSFCIQILIELVRLLFFLVEEYTF